MKARSEPTSGRKRFEYDEGLVFFPLQRNQTPIQVDAVIHGSQMVIEHLPPEIFPTIHYAETPAPAKIPQSGPPVRIMREVEIKVSQMLSASTSYPIIALSLVKELGEQFERLTMVQYGKDGLQFILSDEGNKVFKNTQATTYTTRFCTSHLRFNLLKVKIPQFAFAAKYDEASRSLICEGLLEYLSTRAKAIREETRDEFSKPPKTNVHANKIAKQVADEGSRDVGILIPQSKVTPLDRVLMMLSRNCEGGKYQTGWSDSVIARATSAPIALVKQMREFNCVSPDPKAGKIAELEAALSAISKSLAALK